MFFTPSPILNTVSLEFLVGGGFSVWFFFFVVLGGFFFVFFLLANEVMFP